MNHPATIILGCVSTLLLVWLCGIYTGAAWERESMRQVQDGKLCICKKEQGT